MSAADASWERWSAANRPLHGLHIEDGYKAGWAAGRRSVLWLQYLTLALAVCGIILVLLS